MFLILLMALGYKEYIKEREVCQDKSTWLYKMITTKKSRISIGYQESYKVPIDGKRCPVDIVAKEEINMELRKKNIERKKIICKEKILAKKMMCGSGIHY